MTYIEITPTALPISDGVQMPEFKAFTSAADGAKIDFSDVDMKTLVLIKNNGAAAHTATVKAGDGIQAATDLEVSVAPGKVCGMALESGKFKKLYGEMKGCLHIVGDSTDLQLAAVILP